MLKPEFSEFTFGYAFTENFTTWVGGGVRSVPIFPSLIREGRLDGGYDVAIPARAEPILFQFKIPQIVRRRSRLFPPQYALPYYRMHLEPGAKSTQHKALLEHARQGKKVFYVSPRFDRLDNLDAFYRARSVPDECIYFKPDEIGVLDDQAHFISYRSAHETNWLFSEPTETSSHGAETIREEIRAVARRARPTRDRNEYFAELSRELLRSIEAAVILPIEPVQERSEVRENTSYAFEALRRIESRDLLAIARSTEPIADPIERFVTLATFVLDCHVVLVGAQE